MFPRNAGTSPVRLLVLRFRNCRLVRLLKVEGIWPLNSLSTSDSQVNLLRSPISTGSIPFRLFCASISRSTRPSSPASTPYQSSSGSVLSQLVLSFQLSPSVALYKATSAARSFSTPVGVSVGVGVSVAWITCGSATIVSVAVGVSVAVAVGVSVGGTSVSVASAAAAPPFTKRTSIVSPSTKPDRSTFLHVQRLPLD